MTDGPLLEIEDLRVTYWTRPGLGLRQKPFHAVKGATLSVHPGQTLGLVGESGSGKSSIANAVLGLVPAASGSIRFAGTELAGQGVQLMDYKDPETGERRTKWEVKR